MLFLLLACKPPGPDDIPVASASLSGFDLNRIAVVGGGQGGDALLEWVEPDGTVGELPVRMRGAVVGVVLDVTADLQPGATVPLDLQRARRDLVVRDLLGTYRGTSLSLTVGLGGTTRTLRNRARVRIEEANFTVGVGVWAGLEWLRLKPADEEDLEPGDDDTGA